MSRSIWVVPLALAVVAAACDKGGDNKPFEPAVLGKAVAPPGELGKLKLGMPVEEAKQAAPELVPSGRPYQTFPSGIAGVKFGVGVTDDKTKIDRLKMVLPPDGRAVLEKAWGPGQEATCMRDPCVYWFDPAGGMRGRLEVDSRGPGLEFSTYMPVATLFTKQPVGLAFETAPILGATLDQLKQKYAAQLHVDDKPARDGEPSAYLELLPTEYEAFWTRIQLSFKGGKVDRYWFTIPYDGYPPGKDAILAAIAAGWGKGELAKQVSGEEHVYFDPAGKRRAALRTEHGDDLKIEVTAYLPAAVLLGEGADKIGFETTPLLGQTWEQITKAYPDRIKVRPGEEPQFALPPTEWGAYTTLVHFNYDEKKLASSYRFEIPYGPHPEARDLLWKLLEQKFGGPGTAFQDLGRTKIELRPSGPRVVAEDDTISKGWQIEVSAAAAPAPAKKK